MVLEIVVVAALLALAVVIRLNSHWLGAARVPASLIAGALGWCLFQAIPTVDRVLSPANFGDQLLAKSMQPVTEHLRAWPTILIAVVFSGMLLAKSTSRRTFNPKNLRRVASQAIMVWIIVVGQTAVGLWATWLLIQPAYSLPNSTAMLIETGFAGGHGTAAAMGAVLKSPSVGLDDGLDLGLLMATAGLAFGLISGVVWIQVAIFYRWVVLGGDTRKASASLASGNEAVLALDVSASAGPRLGVARIDGETIDPLLLQLIWIVMAFGCGCLLQQLFIALAGLWDASQFNALSDSVTSVGADSEQLGQSMTAVAVIGSFPLFIYTLFGGVIVRLILEMIGAKQRIDADTIHRIIATAMDVLVVTAVATLNLEVVATLWYPFLVLFLAGSLWCVFCLLVISRWVLPSSIWFHLGLINYGMSTGTTATGFVLLRTIDPELVSGAAEDYALAAPFSAPFVGGGIITIALPLLVLERMPIAASACVATVFVTILILIGSYFRPTSSPAIVAQEI